MTTLTPSQLATVTQLADAFYPAMDPATREVAVKQLACFWTSESRLPRSAEEMDAYSDGREWMAYLAAHPVNQASPITATAHKHNRLAEALRLLNDAGELVHAVLGDCVENTLCRKAYVAVRERERDLAKLVQAEVKANKRTKPADTPNVNATVVPSTAPVATTVTVAPVKGADVIPGDEKLATVAMDGLTSLCSQHGIPVPIGAGKTTLRKLLIQKRDGKSPAPKAMPAPAAAQVTKPAPSFREIQAQCKAMGLNATGSREALEARLAAPIPAPATVTITVDANKAEMLRKLATLSVAQLTDLLGCIN